MLGFCPLAEEAVVHLLSVCSQLSTFRFKIIVDWYVSCSEHLTHRS